jgi:hypothetical protein
MQNKRFASDRLVQIDVGREKPTIVDFQDAQKLASLKWRQDGQGYAVCTMRGFSMHRVIMRPARGTVVHHKNRDRMDNRRSNLEIVSSEVHTQRHDIRNYRFGIQKRKSGTYRSIKGVMGMMFDIGTFETEIDAAMAYDWAARILLGPDAQMNFPQRIVPALAAYLIRTGGRAYFDVGFRKRTTGEFRFFTCRLARRHNPCGEAMYGYILVEVKNIAGYRAVPIEGIDTLYIGDKKYEVVQSQKVRRQNNGQEQGVSKG